MTQPPKTVVKRREFLKVLGSTGAAATAVGCSMERVEQLIPYVVSPDHTVPGVSTNYATICRECAAACGVIAEVRDGRAIKLEGNPDHPVNRGALCARGQAALQGLYNPDRYRGPMIRRDNRLQPATWDEALARVRQGLDEARAANAADQLHSRLIGSWVHHTSIARKGGFMWSMFHFFLTMSCRRCRSVRALTPPGPNAEPT